MEHSAKLKRAAGNGQSGSRQRVTRPERFLEAETLENMHLSSAHGAKIRDESLCALLINRWFEMSWLRPRCPPHLPTIYILSDGCQPKLFRKDIRSIETDSQHANDHLNSPQRNRFSHQKLIISHLMFTVSHLQALSGCSTAPTSVSLLTIRYLLIRLVLRRSKSVLVEC
jgi:hypothetical protein